MTGAATTGEVSMTKEIVDEAVRLLREARQQGAILDFAHRMPEMASLHGYPPFDAVIASRR